jgi:hypothetical protein
VHPFLEQAQVFGVLAHLVERNLVGTPKSFDLLAVDLLRTGPAFRTPQDDERPARRLRFIAFTPAFPRQLLNRLNREFSEAYQGKFFKEQGICKRPLFARLFCACRTRSVLTSLFAK